MLKIPTPDLHARIVSCVSVNRKTYRETKEPFKVCDQLDEGVEVGKEAGGHIINCKLNVILELVTDKELAKKMLLTCITPRSEEDDRQKPLATYPQYFPPTISLYNM